MRHDAPVENKTPRQIAGRFRPKIAIDKTAQVDDLITPQEAMALLRCQRTKLYDRFVNRGLLHRVRFGRRIYFRRSEVMEYANGYL